MNQKRYDLDSAPKRLVARLADGIGRAVSVGGKAGTVEAGSLRKILLVRLDHIGDVLMATPAIRALRKAHPGAEIHLLVKEATSEAVERNPHVDRVLVFNAPWTIPGRGGASFTDTLRLVRRLRAERYDCVVDFRADLREAYLVLSTGAPCRIGYGTRGGGFCFTHLAESDPGEHNIRRNVRLVHALGAKGDGEWMDFFFTPEDLERAARAMRAQGISADEPCAGIHPGAASAFKRWTPKGFGRLGDLLAKEGHRVILLGSRDDGSLLDGIARDMASTPAIVSLFRLPELAALVSRLSLLVCNDSAPSHIAQAVGTRAVVLYGPTHEEITGPLDRERHTVVRHPVPCCPCWRPGTPFRCPYNLRCFRDLSAEDVLQAILGSQGRTVKGKDEDSSDSLKP